MTTHAISREPAAPAPFGWIDVIRLGLVQASIGAGVMVATVILNRVSVIEYRLPAAIPGALVAWHYLVQLARPLWGHGSDKGRRRSPWIIGGMAVLALGTLVAVFGLFQVRTHPVLALLLGVAGFTAIGSGVGAAGTSLLALMAHGVAPARRAAAAATSWVMMVFGIALSAGIASQLLAPFSPGRLLAVASGVVGVALAVSTLAITGLERRLAALPVRPAMGPASMRPGGIGAALRVVLADPAARRFTGFVFLSMLAYSMQELIIDPFAALVFHFDPAHSTGLSGMQHGGVMLGMIVAGVGGSRLERDDKKWIPVFVNKSRDNKDLDSDNDSKKRHQSPVRQRANAVGWIVVGCLGSALALAGLMVAALVGPGWPLAANVALLGFANGVFAVSAVGTMMGLAGGAPDSGADQRTTANGDAGLRMGLWGAAQALAFAMGGFSGASGVAVLRHAGLADALAFRAVFGVEAALFVAAATLALGIARIAAPTPATNPAASGGQGVLA